MSRAWHILLGHRWRHRLELRLAELVPEIHLLVAVGLRRHLLLEILLLGPTSYSRRVITIRGPGAAPAEWIIVHLFLQIFEFLLPDLFPLSPLAFLL